MSTAHTSTCAVSTKILVDIALAIRRAAVQITANLFRRAGINQSPCTIFLRMCRMQFEHRGLSFTLWFSDDACLGSKRDVFYCFFNIISIYYICYDLTMEPLLLQEGSHYPHSQVFPRCIGNEVLT